jgi:hypothetical protein
MYYFTGERMVPPGEQKLAIYRKSLRCSQEGLKRRHPNLEIVDVPYEGSSLAAYFMKSQRARGPARTSSCLGSSGWRTWKPQWKS